MSHKSGLYISTSPLIASIEVVATDGYPSAYDVIVIFRTGKHKEFKGVQEFVATMLLNAYGAS